MRAKDGYHGAIFSASSALEAAAVFAKSMTGCLAINTKPRPMHSREESRKWAESCFLHEEAYQHYFLTLGSKKLPYIREFPL